ALRCAKVELVEIHAVEARAVYGARLNQLHRLGRQALGQVPAESRCDDRLRCGPRREDALPSSPAALHAPAELICAAENDVPRERMRAEELQVGPIREDLVACAIAVRVGFGL